MNDHDFHGEKISALGMGMMRLPTKDGRIDEAETFAIIDYAYAHGINYFDTAWSYHGGESELVAGRALARYPRENWNLASKMPGHETNPDFHPAATFERQLQKCGVDYFDFYLLHNVCENSMRTYLDKDLRIVDYLLEQKEKGRIRHFGFSSHARPDTLGDFLGRYPGCFEFAQIQLNYLDWTLQGAKSKYELLRKWGLPVIVMEPCRGGRLARPGEETESLLRAARPEESAAAWAFRYLQPLPGVLTILSGMSTMEQVKDNVRTFSEGEPLSPEERALLERAAEGMANLLPCTGCRYCCGGCPAGLDIPLLLSIYNDCSFGVSYTPAMAVDALPPERRPSACIGCGACEHVCPQGIPVPEIMKKLDGLLQKFPHWAEICAERAKQKT
ncbi:MAG TPA: aldo/keto reductase [Oscillospiraceae bacterium]|nr:aldo/keto reductase [Oscillospiraceae bacterium]